MPFVANMSDEPSFVESCRLVIVRLIRHHAAPMAIGAVLETVSTWKFYIMRGRMSKAGYQCDKMGTYSARLSKPQTQTIHSLRPSASRLLSAYYPESIPMSTVLEPAFKQEVSVRVSPLY